MRDVEPEQVLHHLYTYFDSYSICVIQCTWNGIADPGLNIIFKGIRISKILLFHFLVQSEGKCNAFGHSRLSIPSVKNWRQMNGLDTKAPTTMNYLTFPHIQFTHGKCQARDNDRIKWRKTCWNIHNSVVAVEEPPKSWDGMLADDGARLRTRVRGS